MSNILDNVLKTLLHTQSTGDAVVEARATRSYLIPVPATLAAGVIDFSVGAEVMEAGEVQSVQIGVTADVTGNDTNYATIFLKKNDGASGAETTVASLALTSGVDPVTEAWTTITLAGSGASTLTAGQALGVEITKTASGLVTPALTLKVNVLPG